MNLVTFGLAAFMTLSATYTAAGDTAAVTDAKAYIVNLQNGAEVKSPVKIIFGLSGMGVAPAGTEKAMTGHHHLFIDRPALGKGPEGKDEFDETIPADEHHKHFGAGQTEILLELAPGQHSLQLVLGDHAHVPHNPPVFSDVITITVK